MAPQLLYIVILVFLLGIVAAKNGEQFKDPYYRFWPSVLFWGLLTAILVRGGFFRGLHGG